MVMQNGTTEETEMGVKYEMEEKMAQEMMKTSPSGLRDLKEELVKMHALV